MEKNEQNDVLLNLLTRNKALSGKLYNLTSVHQLQLALVKFKMHMVRGCIRVETLSATIQVEGALCYRFLK